MRDIFVLGIETSCDETAAAILRLGKDGPCIVSETVRAQIAAHAPYGGVVPEIAARAHAEITDRVVADCLAESGLSLDRLNAIAATCGPGLVGGLMVGMMTGKALALASGKPFIPINHLEGHALSPRLAADCPFPYLLLLVSGGHCQFIAVHALGVYQRLGSTIDDAAGEAFDKLARILNIGFPGGPAVEKWATTGDAQRFKLPRPLLRQPGLDMSFAGLKTAAARIAAAEPMNARDKADLCASYQRTIADCLTEKTARALIQFKHLNTGPTRLVAAGGVAANQTIQAALREVAQTAGARFITPPLRYCGDNGVMIALAGAERLRAGLSPPDGLLFSARSRWPLDEATAKSNPVLGSGKRGVKA